MEGVFRAFTRAVAIARCARRVRATTARAAFAARAADRSVFRRVSMSARFSSMPDLHHGEPFNMATQIRSRNRVKRRFLNGRRTNVEFVAETFQRKLLRDRRLRRGRIFRIYFCSCNISEFPALSRADQPI